ncbi:uncharacterized protein J8A68_005336 [[Candida] subhashii]|uniref:LicD/FKTN/FKRP nucleotidyltransferase domain-containing protein n=1 Tax=[Candida] subhashii TaxID=561895 RepID=A0A8J5QHW4_9ASCO|nr:uncharacterized protein J8A68_005336 [[Candida] subhashii]KAG7661163.1 hypothetical protein J8A68_005336 [[Candida] subhashii]
MPSSEIGRIRRNSGLTTPLTFRRTKLTRLIFLTACFMNLIYFLFYDHYDHLDSYLPHSKFPLSKETIHQYKQKITQRNSFEKSIQKKFREIELNPERFHVAFAQEIEEKLSINLKPFTKSVENENSWINQDTLFYDPRFTLSMYLHELKLQYANKKREDKGTNEVVVLPFHWADWIDLTILNRDLAAPLDTRISCSHIQSVTTKKPDTSYFCRDNSMLSHGQIEQMGFKSSSQLPGFIIHDHCAHDHEPPHDYRILEAKSYAMTTMKKPMNVVILNGQEGTYEFQVNPDINQRLASSEIVENYIRSNKVKNLEKAKLNHLKVWNQLKSKVQPTTLDRFDGGFESYIKMTSSLKHTSQPLKFPLKQSMFSYPAPITEQMAQLEQKQSETGLSVREQVYYEGLLACATYQIPDEPNYLHSATFIRNDERNRDGEKGWHYDWRFFNGALEYDVDGWTEQERNHRASIIKERILRAWFRFTIQKGIISWIQHGPVLSWFWNGLLFPIDKDIDIQLPISEMIRLAKDYNYTLVVEDPSEGYGKYLIDVNTYIHHREINDVNYVEGRFIDIDSGLYIDLTALSKSKSELPQGFWDTAMGQLRKRKKQKNDQVEIYNERRKHFYKFKQLSPLTFSQLQGVPVFIPPKVVYKLVFEYGEGFQEPEFHDWYFVPRLNLWIKKHDLIPVFDPEDITSNGKVNKDKLLYKVRRMTDEEVLKLLENDEILVEYYLTKDLTELHTKEMTYLFDNLGRDNILLGEEEQAMKEYRDLTRQFSFKKPLKKSLYSYEQSIERRAKERNN